MFEGAYGFYAASCRFLLLNQFLYLQQLNHLRLLEDFYPATSHFLPTWFLEEWFLVGKNPTLLVIMTMLE